VKIHLTTSKLLCMSSLLVTAFFVTKGILHESLGNDLIVLVLATSAGAFSVHALIYRSRRVEFWLSLCSLLLCASLHWAGVVCQNKYGCMPVGETINYFAPWVEVNQRDLEFREKARFIE
jgi:hypothetical protein